MVYKIIIALLLFENRFKDIFIDIDIDIRFKEIDIFVKESIF